MKTVLWQVRAIIVGMAMMATVSAHADTIALTFTGGMQVVNAAMVGWTFSTGATPVKVTSLGWWDSGNDGLAGDIQVGIWKITTDQSTDTSVYTLLGSAFVRAGSADTVQMGFQFVKKAINLPANGLYEIGGLSNDADLVTESFSKAPPLKVTTVAGITFRGVALGGETFSAPTISGVGTEGVFGPTFTVTPEPAAWLYIGTGALMLGAIVCRRRVLAS